MESHAKSFVPIDVWPVFEENMHLYGGLQVWEAIYSLLILIPLLSTIAHNK